jgi:hypothetical protein
MAGQKKHAEGGPLLLKGYERTGGGDARSTRGDILYKPLARCPLWNKQLPRFPTVVNEAVDCPLSFGRVAITNAPRGCRGWSLRNPPEVFGAPAGWLRPTHPGVAGAGVLGCRREASEAPVERGGGAIAEGDMDCRKRSRRRPAFRDPGHAHALTFSCYRGYPFLQAERPVSGTPKRTKQRAGTTRLRRQRLKATGGSAGASEDSSPCHPS